MFVHDRHRLILEFLQQYPSSSLDLLQTELGVSRSTLRRDLVELEEQGQLMRIHGGVVHRDSLRGEPTYDKRGREAVEQKRQIAKQVAEKLRDYSTVYLDAGSTCVEVAKQLAARSDIHIFTHSIRLIVELGDCAASVTCVGGEYRHVSQAVVGSLALSWLQNLTFEAAVVGASGLSLQDGASTTETSEAATKQCILTRSRRNFIAADSSKWDKPSAVTFANWQQIHEFVTDRIPDGKMKKSIESHHVVVTVAKKSSSS